LSLTKSDAQWEELPGGPKLTGTALEAWNGKLYRLGGFTAMNKEADDQDLRSQDGFAVFDPATNKWTDLPALPEPRSSHDVDIADGKLYVLGGWNMAGDGNTTWLETAWVCDLSQSELTWTALPNPPFKRRALSVTVHQGQLYAIGGMQETGGPTTRVDVLDLAKGEWSEGPALIGNGMEGFGNASFSVGDHLIATTISGSAQQLNADGTAWEYIGQVHQPRFFHRQLAMPHDGFLIVGGASMATGKTPSVEVFGLKR
jgi:N-acetylneuraminic acid mutarotase